MSTAKTPLLFLSHRIPFPPNKGDKIRSWHLLKHLAKNHRVYLGTFVDDEQDWQYVDHVRDVCEGSYFVRLNPLSARCKSLSALLCGDPLTVPYYTSQDLANWVDYIVRKEGIKKAVVYSSAMAQYVMDEHLPLEQRIIDFVDVDSDKWKQYAENKVWPISAIYQREAKKLLDYDRLVADKFDCNFFVSAPEAQLFKTLAPEVSEKIGSYNNGVDSGYFSPEESMANPYESTPAVLPIVFTGAMDYWPNVDAVTHFARSIFPQVRQQHPNARFVIVGSNPTDEVKALARQAGVMVTGRVEDVRPYIKYAALAVAPMRIARGVQNKVLEAMAMQKPVVVSPQGLEGIQAVEGKEVLVAQDVDQFVQKINSVLDCLSGVGEVPHLQEMILSGKAARQRILADFNWDHSLERVDAWLALNADQKGAGLRLIQDSLQESA